MSISAMTVSTVSNPNKLVNIVYNSDVWDGNISADHLEFNTPETMITYFKKKYKKVYFFRINMARTFGGLFVKPKDLYSTDMNCETEPNCIMVSVNNKLKLVTVKAKRAKEFEAFNSSAKNIYVPLMIYKDVNKVVRFINFK